MTTTVKWSAFTDGNEVQVGDEVVGLRSGGNYRFEFPGTGIKDGNGNYLISYSTNGAGATNYITIENNVASNKPAISTAGTDASVGLTISTKGSGVVSIPTIVSDITQLNVDNIRLDGNTITSTDTAGNILITPDTTGNLVLDGLNWPQADGSANTILYTNGAGQLAWTASAFPVIAGTLNHLLRSDGADWVETTAVTIDASDVISGATQINVDNIRLDGNTISSTDTNGAINMSPNGTGAVVAGTGSTSFQINSSTAIVGVIDDDSMATATATNVPTSESVVAHHANVPGAAGGSTTQVQYNNAGTLNGDTGFTTNGAGSLTVTGDLSVDNININGNSIISSDTNGDILVTPNGIGNVGIGVAVPTVKLDILGDTLTTGTATVTGDLQVDNLNVNGNTIISSDTAGDINLTPDTTGDLVLDGLKWPQADGSASTVLYTNGAGQLAWTASAFPVTAGTLNHLLRSDGTNWIETTAITIDASDVLSGATQVNVDNLRLDGNTISNTAAATDLSISTQTGGLIKLDGQYIHQLGNYTSGFINVGVSSITPTTLTYIELGRPALTAISRFAAAYGSGVHHYVSGQTSGIMMSAMTGVKGALHQGLALYAATSSITGAAWSATQTSGAAMIMDAGEFQWVSGTGLSVGTTPALTQHMTLDASGNLGIGTTSPALAGGGKGIHIHDATPELKFTNTTTGSGAANGTLCQTQSLNFGLINRENGKIFFSTNNTARMTVSSSGDVGIGTVAPAAKLDVNGAIHADSISFDSGVNALDAYEEGTWTPVISDASTGGNVSPGTGVSAYWYQRAGNVVTVHASIVNISTVGMTAGNGLYIQSLPFAQVNTTNLSSRFVALTSDIALGASSPFQSIQNANASWLAFYEILSSGSNQMIVSDLTSTSADINFTITYKVA